MDVHGCIRRIMVHLRAMAKNGDFSFKELTEFNSCEKITPQ